MNLKVKFKKATAVLLTAAMLLSLSGCDGSAIFDLLASQLGVTIVAGERLKDSPWINSDLKGSIDENTELNLKDDFHTTVNRDWMLENQDQELESVSVFTDIAIELESKIMDTLTPGTEYAADPNVMSQEELDHLQYLIWDMMELAGSWENRNQLGTEPLKPYLEAIESIETLEDLTDYLINEDGMNFTGENFMPFFVNVPQHERDYYTVHISSPDNLLLDDSNNYTYLSSYNFRAAEIRKEALHHVLGDLGYSAKQIDQLFKKCYLFESKMSNYLPTSGELESMNYSYRGDKIYTLEDLEKRQGSFPLTGLLEAAGVVHSDSFRLYEPGFLYFMSKNYTEKNLESMKAYLLVHTVLEALPYLDETCSTYHLDIEEALKMENESEDFAEPAPETDPQTDLDYETTLLMQEYIMPHLMEAFQLTYIGRYCSSAMKQEITQMLEDIRDYFEQMLMNTQWLSLQTRQLAVDKLQKMVFNVLYPDNLTDYSSLVYEGYDDGGNLVDAMAAITRFHSLPDAEKVNQKIDRSDWSLEMMPTIDVNAAYALTANSVNILAGIMSNDFLYDVDAPIEVNYGRLGVVLGHEMTHAFDTGGYQFDAEGLQNGWWTNEDEVAFRERSTRLGNYYSTLNILPGQVGGYVGSTVESEAIADMGGVKCMLGLAEEIPDFDYDLFFRSFANVWRSQNTIRHELSIVGDVHPLGFLRTNVTLQQFDKFYETYDIGPGDGMYLAPEDRVMVW